MIEFAMQFAGLPKENARADTSNRTRVAIQIDQMLLAQKHPGHEIVNLTIHAYADPIG